MPDVSLRQVRSAIGSDKKQIATLRTLKLGKIGRESTLEDTPQMRGALAKVEHLVALVGPAAGADGKAVKSSGSSS